MTNRSCQYELTFEVVSILCQVYGSCPANPSQVSPHNRICIYQLTLPPPFSQNLSVHQNTTEWSVI